MEGQEKLTLKAWPRNPLLYEINTWTWLQELRERYHRPIGLGNVPDPEWEELAARGFDAVWLMGVWERSPESVRIAREHTGLQAEYRRALPDYSDRDVVGSPYSVHRYGVDRRLGGPEGLQKARSQLARRHMRLILDYVPNHLAPDHPWVAVHPDYFIRGNREDLLRAPGAFFESGGTVFAHGRDPHFPPWTDTAQLNAFHPGLRRTAVETLRSIADQADGVRCDMAMLLMNDTFRRTWGERAGARPETEFWVAAIGAVHETHPGFLFMAEAYWDLEWALQQQGFNACYDKRLYDRLVHENAESVRLHLLAEPSYQEKLVRFIENHDEPRAAAAFPPQKARAAAATVATLPGARLFHHGQFEGRRVRLPVQLGRGPVEPIDFELRSFYEKLLSACRAAEFQRGTWHLCPVSGWPDNASARHLVAWCWQSGDRRCLVVVNFSDRSAQGRVALPWEDLEGRLWRLADLLSGTVYERNGTEMVDPGLYVDLEGWEFHFLKLRPER